MIIEYVVDVNIQDEYFDGPPGQSTSSVDD